MSTADHHRLIDEPEAPESRGTDPYLRIASVLRGRIESGSLPPHAMISSERDLATEFGVSRMTARRALTLLVNEGHVYRNRPRGTFVAEPRIRLRIGSFSDEVRRSGNAPGAQLLWSATQPPTPEVRTALDLAEEAEVYVLRRLRMVNNEPMAIETNYFPSDLVPGLLDQPGLEGFLWALLREQYGISAARAQTEVEVVALDDQASEQLGLRQAAPAILMTRRAFDADGRCFEYVRDLYRADRTIFQLESEFS